jgi:hypothetical protein
MIWGNRKAVPASKGTELWSFVSIPNVVGMLIFKRLWVFCGWFFTDFRTDILPDGLIQAVWRGVGVARG